MPRKLSDSDNEYGRLLINKISVVTGALNLNSSSQFRLGGLKLPHSKKVRREVKRHFKLLKIEFTSEGDVLVKGGQH